MFNGTETALAAEQAWWAQILIGYVGLVIMIMVISLPIMMVFHIMKSIRDCLCLFCCDYRYPKTRDGYKYEKSSTELHGDLMIGVLKGNVAQVKKALDEGAKRDTILNKKDQGTTPLFSAVEGAKKEDDTFTEIAIMLLNAGADKNVTCNWHIFVSEPARDYTAKDIAAHNKNNKLLKALIKKSALEIAAEAFAESSLPRPISARSAEKDKKKN